MSVKHNLLDIYSASAGSGKTYNLAMRFVDVVIREPHDYSRVLAVTFTNKATDEMKRRIITDLYALSFDISVVIDDYDKFLRRLKQLDLLIRQLKGVLELGWDTPQHNAESKCRTLFEQEFVYKNRDSVISDVDVLLRDLKTQYDLYCSYKGKGALPSLAEDEQCRSVLRNVKINVLVENCRTAMCLLLNDYGKFNVSTIDKFVQKVIRSFAFEHGFSSNYGVEIDDDILLNHAIDEMMSSMEDDSSIKSWIMDFVNSKIEEKDDWSVEFEIKKMSLLLNNPQCQLMLSNLSKSAGVTDVDLPEQKLAKEIQYLKNVRAEMMSIIKKQEDLIIDEVCDMARRFPDLTDNDFESEKPRELYKTALRAVAGGKDKYRKRLLAAYYNAGTVKKYGFKGVKSRKEPASSYEKLIDDCYMQFLALAKEKDYCTAKLVCQNIYAIGLLTTIDRHYRCWASVNNLLPIADSNRMLSKLLGSDKDVPFVYEKIGTHIDHIMLDEFQDTSNVQWSNFLPLIKNSLSNNKNCLVVGDVKQAIYRFRDSDWTLLAHGVKRDIGESLSADVNLVDNYRTRDNIVDFNNDLFDLLRNEAQTKYNEVYEKNSQAIEQIYSKCRQEKKGEKGGYVSVRVFSDKKSKGKKTDGVAKSMDDIISDELIDHVRELHDDYGYSYKMMNILVAENKEGTYLVGKLSQSNIPVMSADALELGGSTAVKAIMQAMRYIVSPSDESNLLSFYATCMNEASLTDVVTSWGGDCSQIKDDLRSMSGMGLIEMSNKIVSMLPAKMVEDEFVYIESFIDMVRSYIVDHHVNLSDFVCYFEERGYSKKVSPSPDQDAVLIMTIHKSKGLEAPVIFIPFADWNMVNSRNNIWCEPSDSRFAGISPLPLSNSSSLKDSYFDECYCREGLLDYVDSLNLFYVANTRPKDALCIWSRATGVPDNIGKHLLAVMEGQYGSCSEYEGYLVHDYQKGEVFNYGSKDKKCNAVPSKKLDVKALNLKPYNFNGQSRVVNINKTGNQNASRRGVAMHAIMENITTIDDVDYAVDKIQMTGAFNKNEAALIKAELKTKLNSPEIKPFFDVDPSSVYKEINFLSQNQFSERRMDRLIKVNGKKAVVIDYKFGEHETTKNVEQVKTYVGLLVQAGFDDAEGYLWYYSDNKLEKV